MSLDAKAALLLPGCEDVKPVAQDLTWTAVPGLCLDSYFSAPREPRCHKDQGIISAALDTTYPTPSESGCPGSIAAAWM